MMKNVMMFCLIFVAWQMHAQALPTDDALLRVIYGKAYSGQGVYSRPFADSEQHSPNFKLAEYRIVYKSQTVTANHQMLLVIVEAPINTLHGHIWGYIDYYFLAPVASGWKVANVLKSEEPVGDASEFSEIAIGRSNRALVKTFTSTGNQHYEKTHQLYSITPHELTFLFEITVEYSNEAFNQTSSDTGECVAKKYFTTYEVINNDRDWFDVKAREKIYGFTSGCKEAVLSSEQEYIFKHNGIEYKQQLVRSDQ